MHRTKTSLSMLLLAFALAAGAVVAAPASGQVEAEIETLEARRDEIGIELGQIDTDLALTEAELEVLDREREAAEVQIELTADDLERAVDARREPAATRVEIAIVGFTQGDPRENALLDEVLALQGSDENTRARELYTAVIDDAQTRLENAEAGIRAVAERLETDRVTLADVIERQEAAETLRTELGQRRTELTLELEEAVARIELLRSLEDTALLTGLTTFDAQARPALAVKIDNVSAAWPQAGINQADIVYVEEVEGGLTRLAAVFHSTTPEQVGPVRSMRTGDFDLLGQFNSPLFANSGGNRIARQLLRNSTLVDIGAGSNGDLYFRTSRPAPHNLFTNPGNLWSVAVTDDLPTGFPLPIFRFRDADAPIRGDVAPATGVDIDYGQTVVSYDWNGSGWERTQDGTPTVDTAGVRTAPTTVVIQITRYTASAADLQSPEAITTGRGEVWILTDGQVTRGFWRRDEEAIDQPIEYVDAAGNFIEILPGRTWVEMPRDGDAVLR
ncbi:MAG: DUF3048 domain-containing protein [Actinomycetota bacterium]